MLSYSILFSLNFIFIDSIIKTYIFITFIQFIKNLAIIIKKYNNCELENKIPIIEIDNCPICLIDKKCNVTCSGEYGKRHPICVDCYEKLEIILCPLCRGSMMIYNKSIYSNIINEIINIMKKIRNDITIFIIIIFVSLCVLDIIILFIEFIKYIF